MLRSVGLKRQDCLYSGTGFLSVYVPVTVLGWFYSKELLCLLLVQEAVGKWIWFRVGG
ncbi:hypothetical protein A2U01_0071816 [Trifolium medium]|uniref:Uncharacterized protein n=1 Tax=Trifolium medium TaxID=97028 RepID=A0A392SQ80_9FABA|nr:hypothetical protein [Trifolium medium]